jgi:hypothetical protein
MTIQSHLDSKQPDSGIADSASAVPTRDLPPARPECFRSPYLDVSVDVGMMMAAKMLRERAGEGKPPRVELHLNEGELARMPEVVSDWSRLAL